MESSTSRREPALHTSPWLKKMPKAAAVAAASRSGQSAITMCGVLPPHSSETCFMLDSPAYSQEILADLGRAGEGDGVDVHVEAERLAGGLAEAGHAR